MRIVITGALGQLGSTVARLLANENELILLDRDEIELSQPRAVEQLVATKAELIIHPAAYTDVDGCARDPEWAYRVNALGTKYVAQACRSLDAPMVYISTNEVFAGNAGRAYMEYDQTGPINAYGRSKLAGELAVREILRDFYIVRIAWLFGGERNFVRTVLRLAANPPAGGLRMVDDEIGNPTYCPDLAAAIIRLIATKAYGTYHLVNSGACSRHAFASEILRQAGYHDLPIAAIKLADYQRASTPPPYSPLLNIAAADLGITLRPWQEALAEYLTTLA